MPTGLAIPIGVNDKGRTAVVTGSENDDKIVLLALGDDSNENAFQQNIGLGVGMVFDPSDVATRAKVVSRITDIFRRFERQKRFKLMDATIQWSVKDGDTFIEFWYLNTESDDPRKFGPVLVARKSNG